MVGCVAGWLLAAARSAGGSGGSGGAVVFVGCVGCWHKAECVKTVFLIVLS